MPKLWQHTIESHRSAVEEAIMESAAALAARDGITSLTMSKIAEDAGIGRATLYKYFSDVGQILVRWHEGHVERHLQLLEAARDSAASPIDALETVLTAFAENNRHSHGHSFAAALHTMPHIQEAHRRVENLVANLIASALASGALRSDASPGELARYAVSALAAAQTATSRPAAKRLVAMVMRGLGA
jgi:AcrR family transcriptional regulator